MIKVDYKTNSLLISGIYLDESKFKYSYQEYQTNFYTGQARYVDVSTTMFTYENGTYRIPMGHAMYLYNTHPGLVPEDKAALESVFANDKKFVSDYMMLRPDQVAALDEWTKYKRGILTVYTGWGKTQVAAVLMKNLSESFEGNILAIGGKNMIIDELKNRFESFGVYKSTTFDKEQKINVVNPNGFLRSNIYKEMDTKIWLSKVKFVLMDEVDRLSDSSIRLLNAIGSCGCQYFYGMSATAEAAGAQNIAPVDGLMNIMNPHLNCVTNIFSHSAVYKKPDKFNINLNQVKMGNPSFTYMNQVEETGNTHYDVMYGFCTSNNWLKFMDYVMERGKPLIPINYTTIIDKWLEHCHDKSIIVLSGSGYNHYVGNKLVESLDIQTLKEVTQEGLCDAVFTTSTGFSAVDFRGISDVVLLAGTEASTILQYIGRVTRSNAFNIWYSTYNWGIPIYTKNQVDQLALIKKYYDQCNITENTYYYGQ